MTSRLLAVTFGAQDPDRLARFWSSLLDRDADADADGVLLPGDETQVGLRFAPARAERRGPNRVHLHITSERSSQETVVAKALDLGAGHLDVGQLPEEPHVVLGDPEGNEFCVIPPDNGFLAGCGALGEVERLVSLGASRVSRSEPGAVVLADPDGNEFRLRRD